MAKIVFEGSEKAFFAYLGDKQSKIRFMMDLSQQQVSKGAMRIHIGNEEDFGTGLFRKSELVQLA